MPSKRRALLSRRFTSFPPPPCPRVRCACAFLVFFRNTTGEIYTGEYDEDERCGLGTFRYRNGDLYDGEWRKGKRHGQATLVYSDGRTYAGGWRADAMAGDGTMTLRNGDVKDLFDGKPVVLKDLKGMMAKQAAALEDLAVGQKELTEKEQRTADRAARKAEKAAERAERRSARKRASSKGSVASNEERLDDEPEDYFGDGDHIVGN